MHTNTSIDFIRVAVHEVLHSLGMHHSVGIPNDILAPTYNPNVPIYFSQDTIDGLESMYGKKVTEEPTPTPEPPTVPVPSDCKSVLAKVFTSRKRLNRLLEVQLVTLAHELGLNEVTASDRKRVTLDKVFNVIHNL